MTQQKQPKSIIFPLVISIIAISFSAIFVKWSESPATISSMYRMWLAALFLVPIVWIKRGEFKKITIRDWYYLISSGAFLGLHFALWFGSLKLTTVASSTIILALQPLIAVIFGFLFYKERTNLHALVTMAIAVIGVSFIAWGDIALSQEAIIGDLLSFLSVISVVGYLLIGQRIVKKLSHWVYSFLVFSIAAIILTFYNIVTQVPLGGYPLKEWGIFLLLAVVPTISHVINNWLLKYINTTTISMSILGEPVGASFLAFLLLGERLTFMQIIGGFIVLISVFYFLIHQQKEKMVSKDTISKNIS